MALAAEIELLAARRFWFGDAAYILPSFPIAFVWHLVLFGQKYHAPRMYRDEPVIAFGLISMIIQGSMILWSVSACSPHRAARSSGRIAVRPGHGPAVVVVHDHRRCRQKHNDFCSGLRLLESAFTILQFVVVGPIIALAHRR
jgi:hypothetical protein